MKRTIRTLMMLAAVVGTSVVTPAVSRADDDDGEQAPKNDDDEAQNDIRRQGKVFDTGGATSLPFEFTSDGKYRKGEITVTAKVVLPEGADCSAKEYTIAIESDVPGKKKTVKAGGTVKVTGNVKGQITVKISFESDPGCDATLEASGWYSPDPSR